MRILEIILPTVGKIDAPDRVPMGTPESTGRHPISGTPNGDSMSCMTFLSVSENGVSRVSPK